MKKKLLTSVLSAGVLLMSASPVLAAGSIDTDEFGPEAEIPETTVNLTIESSYTVTIPNTITASRNAFELGAIEFEVGASNVVLPNDTALDVSVAESTLTSEEGAELNLDAASVQFLSPNADLEDEEMSLNITQENTPAGDYTGEIQFVITEGDPITEGEPIPEDAE